MWLVNARPDVAAFISLVSSVTEKAFSQADVEMLNEKTAFLKRTKKVHFGFRGWTMTVFGWCVM